MSPNMSAVRQMMIYWGGTPRLVQEGRIHGRADRRILSRAKREGDRGSGRYHGDHGWRGVLRQTERAGYGDEHHAGGAGGLTDAPWTIRHLIGRS